MHEETAEVFDWIHVAPWPVIAALATVAWRAYKRHIKHLEAFDIINAELAKKLAVLTEKVSALEAKRKR